jgi:hypothetical protein
MQPTFAPLIFADHARRGIAFTTEANARRSAEDLARRLSALFGVATPLFLGRIGRAPARAPAARSLRQPLAALIEKDDRAAGRPTDAAG